MKRILFFSLVLFVPILIKSQNTIGLPQVINYNKNEFHGGSQTWDIAQDHDGRMYFANNEGLLCYDGATWKIQALPNKTIVRSVAIDKNGKIYVGGQGEIGYFLSDNKGFLQYHSLLPIIPTAQKTFADIWDIEINGESIFFRATDRIFHLKNNSISIYPPISEWQFLSQNEGKIYAQDRENGLLLFQNNKWRPLKNNILIHNLIINGIISKGNDSLLISTTNNKFYLLKGDSLSPTIQKPVPLNTKYTYRICELNKNEFVSGTTSEGCLIINFNGKIVQKISKNEGLQNNNVLSSFVDSDKNIWLGLNNGISFIAYNSAIKYISPNKQNEVSGYSAKIFNKTLFIGSSDGAYSVPLAFEKNDLSFSKGEFSLIKNSEGQVWRLDEINEQLLMAHHSGCFLIQNNQANLLSKDASWLFLAKSNVLPTKYVLVGTYKGLKLLESSGKNFNDLGNLKGTYESFRFLEIDNEDQIWASHPYRGIYKIDITNNNSQYTTKLFSEADGLPSRLDNHIFKIKNRMVVATMNGIYEYNTAQNKFAPSELFKSITGNIEIRYLNEDSDGNIWFCTGKKLGVIEFNQQNLKTKPTITFFPEITGQILSGFEDIYVYNNENVFISSEKGIIHLNYKKYKENKSKTRILLGTIKTIGDQDSLMYGGYLDAASFEKQTDIALPNKFNSFHFEFSSPAFGHKNNVEFSYKLKGYDVNWSGWTSKTEKDYTNLTDGRYQFQVKSRDNLGNESQPIIYSFVVNPPFYKSFWAYLFYIIIGGITIYGVSLFQKRKLHIQRVKFEEKQNKINILHQLELEKNEKELIKLRNEKLEGEIFLKTKELADTSMHLVERNDALKKIKDELQKMHKNTSENHDIKKTIQLLNDIEKNDANWDNFASHFDEINNNFLKKLKTNFPKLTNTDLKVCTYLQLNLASKEIAQLMNISVRGIEISRYRLRKKLNLKSDQSLIDFLNKLT